LGEWTASDAALATGAGGVRLHSKKEESMTDQNEPSSEKNEMRVMWIGSAAVVLLLLAAMGINMLIAHGTGAGATETRIQTDAALPK
jgi:hypothetical protein